MTLAPIVVFMLALDPARAQELPPPPEAPALPGGVDPATLPFPKKGDAAVPVVPVPWRITVFEDAPGSPDCDQEAGLRGLCVEDVLFAMPPHADDDRSRLAQWRNVAMQFSDVWEGLTYRWSLDGDPIASSIVAAGYSTLPSPADTWDAFRANKRSISIPDRASWLQADTWISTEGNDDAWFPRVRYRVTTGGHAPDQVVLDGRFASRLGFEGTPHDYELMDGDPDDSSPFFEQLYPYEGHVAAGVERPLAPFDLPSLNVDLTPEDQAAVVAHLRLEDRSFEGIRRAAKGQFVAFQTLLYTQVAQFALQDFTQNQMRVLTALAAIVTPPGVSVEQARGGGRQLVAAALGETDDVAEQAQRIQRSEFAVKQGLVLNIDALPQETVNLYVRVLHARDPLTAEQIEGVFVGNQRGVGKPVRQNAEALLDPRAEAMTTWAAAAANPGFGVQQLVSAGQRQLLAFQLDRLRRTPDLRARFETAILLDQVQRAAVSVFDETDGVRAAPLDVVTKVTDQWVGVLGRHGLAPRLIPQGLGAVDPTAICTTLDGVAALTEPSFGAVNLDVLVRAADGVTTVDALLVEARDQLPFLLVDDPDLTAPKVEVQRLVGLPGGRAVYRIRWRLWTGWHLFWTEEALPGGGTRLAVRTGAVCDDTTLAPPDLVPTLLRASLLEGDFRSPEPVPLRLGRKPDAALHVVDDPDLRQELAALRGYLLAPIERLAKALDGVLVVVTDVDDPSPPRANVDVVPRVPYARKQVGAPGGKAVLSAMWARFFADKAVPDAPIVYPAFKPSPNVGSTSLYPTWNRSLISNFTFTTGHGYFPLRTATSHCQETPTSPGFVAPCGNDDETVTHSEGFGADVQALTTLWVFDEPRIAVETGLEVRIDVSHAGDSWTFPDDGGPSANLMFRPAGGLLLGVRSAPPPAPLTGGAAGVSLWGPDRVDGSSRLGRVEYGARGGFLLAPSYFGAEGTVLAELWGGFSARRNNARLANFSPYNPRAVYGIFVRGQYGFTLVQDDPDQAIPSDTGATLRHSEMLIFGIRGTWDLQIQLPEAPKTE
jgi:hypothetical protein